MPKYRKKQPQKTISHPSCLEKKEQKQTKYNYTKSLHHKSEKKIAQWETSAGEWHFWSNILVLRSVQIDHTAAKTRESQVFRYTAWIGYTRQSSHRSWKEVSQEERARHKWGSNSLREVTQ